MPFACELGVANPPFDRFPLEKSEAAVNFGELLALDVGFVAKGDGMPLGDVRRRSPSEVWVRKSETVANVVVIFCGVFVRTVVLGSKTISGCSARGCCTVSGCGVPIGRSVHGFAR